MAELDIEYDSETTWQEVFEVLTASEQSCIREALGDGLESSLGKGVANQPDMEDWELSIFGCLREETARALFLSMMVWSFTVEESLELSEAEQSCLRESVWDADVVAVFAWSADPDGVVRPEDFMGEMFACVPDVMLAGFVGELGELSEVEKSCLRERVGTLDWLGMFVEDAGALEGIVELFACVPGVLLSEMIGTDVKLSETQAKCAQEAVAGLNVMALIAVGQNPAATPEEFPELLEGFVELFSCVPGVFLSGIVGMDVELSETQAKCAQEAVAGLNVMAMIAAGEDPAASSEEFIALFACVPGVMVSELFETDVELTEAEASCVSEWLRGMDFVDLVGAMEGDDVGAAAFGQFSRVFSCLPDLFVSKVVVELGGDLEELSEEERSCLRDWLADVDWDAMGESESDEAVGFGLFFGAFSCLPEVLEEIEGETGTPGE